MKHYCSIENYLSVEEMEKLLACDDVKAVFFPHSETFTIHLYLFDVFLGSTRKLKRIPKHSRFPRLAVRACSNRYVAEKFQ